MKKLTVLLLAAGLMLGVPAGTASAVDFKISGEWDFNWEQHNLNVVKADKGDTFAARQRLRTQVDVIASEHLSGVVFLEIGDTYWGEAESGGAWGSDAKNVEVRYSYVDWVVPQTDLKVRMGLQPFALPSFVAGSPVLDDVDGAGITLAYEFNDNVGATLFWTRAENGNALDPNTGDPIDRGQDDAMDFVGLSVPVTGDGWALTPWALYGNIGRNSLLDPGESGDIGEIGWGLLPVTAQLDLPNQTAGVDVSDGYTAAWWLGLGGELKLYEPLRVAFDFSYGKVDWGKDGTGNDLTREGWLAIGAVEYALDVVTPGLIFWYGSGDDDNMNDGSERMPVAKASWTATSFGWDGAYGISDGAIMGLSPAGTWGVILNLSDISFVENLSHVVSLGYYTGTNDKAAAKELGAFGFGDAGALYLTEKDHAFEVDFNTEYQVYENLTLAVEMGWIRMDIDEDLWGVSSGDIDRNIYKFGLNLNYAF